LASRHEGPLTSRLFWLIIGLGALLAAFLGVVAPLIPTTPFVLLAAFAFMRSSKRLHAWIINHRLFGKLISDWHQHKAIGRPAKIAAIVSMVAVFVISVALQVPGWVLALQAVILGVVMWFVGSRPLPPEDQPEG
jgi:uncharacterized membrane protein YbaN (DUF454 family)